MESKDKVKLLRKFTDLVILAEDNGLTASFNYSSCHKGISYSLRRQPQDEYIIFTHIWVDQITFEEGEKKFTELLERTNEIYRL
jgi:hypothetical protein